MTDPKSKVAHTPSTIEILKAIRLFRDLNETDLAEFSAVWESRRYVPGDIVAWEGEMGDEFFIIRSGCVAVFKGQAPKESVMTALVQGSFFGVTALFERVKRTVSVRATEKLDLLVINREIFLGFIHAHPRVGSRVYGELLKQVFIRLDFMNREVESMTDGEITREAAEHIQLAMQVVRF